MTQDAGERRTERAQRGPEGPGCGSFCVARLNVSAFTRKLPTARGQGCRCEVPRGAGWAPNPIQGGQAGPKAPRSEARWSLGDQSRPDATRGHPESPRWTKTLPLPGNSKGWAPGQEPGRDKCQFLPVALHLPRQKPAPCSLPQDPLGFPVRDTPRQRSGPPPGKGGALGAKTKERTPGTCRPARPPPARGLSSPRFP